jgi:hypothetical protein
LGTVAKLFGQILQTPFGKTSPRSFSTVANAYWLQLSNYLVIHTNTIGHCYHFRRCFRRQTVWHKGSSLPRQLVSAAYALWIRPSNMHCYYDMLRLYHVRTCNLYYRTWDVAIARPTCLLRRIISGHQTENIQHCMMTTFSKTFIQHATRL